MTGITFVSERCGGYRFNKISNLTRALKLFDIEYSSQFDKNLVKIMTLAKDG